MTRRPRVLLADDHRMFAEGLRSLLAEEFDLLGVVEDGVAMIDAAKRLLPDVIVADITMPGMTSKIKPSRIRRLTRTPVRRNGRQRLRNTANAARNSTGFIGATAN